MRMALGIAAVAVAMGCGEAGDDDGAGRDGGADPADGDAAPGERVDPPTSDITSVSVATADELVAALASATPGSVVEVTADIDLTGREAIVVPAQVTISGGGGEFGAGGALLYTNQLDTMPLFRAGGPGVRFTGIRLRGPDPDIGATPYGEPVSQGINASHADNLQVDHSELSGWAHAAVALDFSRRAYVHRNSMHHNRRTGLGYGVVLIHDADALIERNRFDANRHSIAATGRAGISYHARYNLVGATRNGHAYDMHGEDEADDNGSPNAGDRMDIHHNSFLGTAQGIVIRGRPRIGAYISSNCFGQSSGAGTAVIQRFFFGNLFVGSNLYSQASGSCHTGAAPGRAVRSDVNGDGMSDVVTLVDGTAYTYLGSASGGLIPAPPVFAGTMKTALWDGEGHLVIDVADVNGDFYADLVTAFSDGNVMVYPGGQRGAFGGGVASFAGTYATDAFEPIAVADVNGDGFGDLVSQHEGSVVVHPGRADATFGTSVSSFAGTYDSALLDGVGHFAIDVADVTGDGRADLVTGTDTGTAYVFPGQASGAFGSAVPSFNGTLQLAFLDGSDFEPIAVADVNGDGRADLISAHTEGTVYVYPGKGDGTFTSRAESFHGTMPTSLFGGIGFEIISAGDVTGDGRADLITVHPERGFYIYPGTSDFTFTTGVASFAGEIRTTRFERVGYEAVGEKSLLRRRGCAATGCF
jgi:hypothetical protein